MFITGVSAPVLNRRVARGEITKIARGLYWDGRPNPRELLTALLERYPQAVATGVTAAQLMFEAELTFPLQLARGTRAFPSTEFVNFIRTTQLHNDLVDGIPVHLPLLAAANIVHDGWGIQLLDKAYKGRAGKRLAEQHLQKINRLPARARELLDNAALGTDSGAEQLILRKLKQRGIKAPANVRIGVYLWDIVIEDMNVAIEINGFDYHSGPLEMIRDAWKANDATARRWVILRYTGHCVAFHPDMIVEQIITIFEPNFEGQAHQLVGEWHFYANQYDFEGGSHNGPDPGADISLSQNPELHSEQIALRNRDRPFGLN